VSDTNVTRPVSTFAENAIPFRQATPSLSLIIPAYNEAARIEATIKEARAWLDAQSFASELIVVDDGSEDATAVLAERELNRTPNGRLIRAAHRGKAAAVRIGVQEATRDQIAFSDADLATPLSYLLDLRSAIDHGCDVAIGSREGPGAKRIGEPDYRHVMGRVFNTLVRLLLLRGIQDTQCGFKLFRAEVARDLFCRSRLYDARDGTVSGPRVTAFDVELLTIARLRGYRICPVPVIWTYGEGSKVRPTRDTWHNLRDVVQVWIDKKRGLYS
jgi:dolichyl-phosphate beta-glucosyltransferase